MRLPNDPEIRAVLGLSYARDFVRFIRRRHAKSQGESARQRYTTVSQLAGRFLMPTTDVAACIAIYEADCRARAIPPVISVSSFAFRKPSPLPADAPPAATWAATMLAAYHPTLDETAPLGARIVMLLEDQ